MINDNLAIPRRTMPTLPLLWNFIWRSGTWGLGVGAVLGFLYGFAVIALWSLSEVFGPHNQLNLFDTIRSVIQIGSFVGIIGIIIGIPIGLLLGLTNGLIIGIVTLLLFPTLPNIQSYSDFVRFISMIITVCGASIGFYLTIFQQIDNVFIFLILPAIDAGVGAWWVSGQMVKWYARAIGLRL
jgi:hypothetical protein